MAAIRPLPDLLINQIAAGEVVERPAAALKELLENALDAGATQIDVDLAAGGGKRIRVADDGGGIEREDLRLAVARHATSKIRRARPRSDRLARLPRRGAGVDRVGVAAVARVARRRQAACVAHRGRGRHRGADRAGGARGRNGVTVEELFFNTPARRKFLRTEATEWGHCDEAFRRIALAHPRVAFTLQHNGRVVHRLPAAGRQARVEQLLGDDFVAHAARVDVEAGDIALAGFAVVPRTRRRAVDSTSSSTAASCAIACCRTRCARRIATCCITTGSRRTRCG